MKSKINELRNLGFTEDQVQKIVELYKNQQEFIVNENLTDQLSENFEVIPIPLIKTQIGFDILNPLNRDPLKKLLSETEKCVYCGVNTDIPIHMSVDLREYYIDGAGQLCKECYDKVFKSKTANL